ncbi:hypothetical protein, partial [Paracoccus sp. (in: a-proteobacteria)]|uniref:hypothetical protein n=1 Tax=Paracoccus sp. TaxID=267 RepID=UPI003A857E81
QPSLSRPISRIVREDRQRRHTDAAFDQKIDEQVQQRRRTPVVFVSQWLENVFASVRLDDGLNHCAQLPR